MARLKRTLNRTVGDKRYYRWLVADLPPALIEQLGWEEGEAISVQVRSGSLILRRKE